jgi:hypothetical protein
LPNLSTLRFNAAAGKIGTQLYIVGGQRWSQAVRDVESLETATGLWRQMPPMCSRRSAGAAASTLDFLYVCGGWSADWQALDSVECFCPKANAWHRTPSMMAARDGAVAVAAARCILVFGGRCDGQCLSSGEVYDPRTSVWTPLADMKERRSAAASVMVRG